MQLIQDLQQQHQQEVAALLKEKDQQLQKKTLTGKKHSHRLRELKAFRRSCTFGSGNVFPQPSLQ